MSDMESLNHRLASLLEDAAGRREHERTLREHEMQDLEPRRSRFEELAGVWVNDLVLPRLRALAQTLPQHGEVKHISGGRSARLELGWSNDYPVAASLSVSITPDDRYGHASVHIQPLLIPMLVGHPSASCFEIAMDVADPESLAQFLDDQCVNFAESYLRVREPDSPYQRSALVIDPVCRMSFHSTDAAESHEYEGKRFFFCAHSCAERFLQSPDRYTHSSREPEGGL